MRPDIFGVIPQVGDKIIFNPPRYKGLAYGVCTGFMPISGLPIVDISPISLMPNQVLVPKTGFVVVK